MNRPTFFKHEIDAVRTVLHREHGISLDDLSEEFDRVHDLAVEVGEYEDRVNHGPVVPERELRDMAKASRFLFIALTGLAVETTACYGIPEAAARALFAYLLDAAADSCQAFTDAQNDAAEVGAAR